MYVRVAERWRPYRERTVLREAAEIVVSGSLATLVGVVVALLVARVTDLLSDREALIDGAGRYLVFHPGRMGLTLLIILTVSYGLAWLVARFAPGRGAEVFADSGWYGALERKLPKDHGVAQFVLLRGDQIRYITGEYRELSASEA